MTVALVLGGRLLHSRNEHALTDKDTIVLADFANTSGDRVFDDTLRQGLSVQLEQSPFLKLISDERIRQTLRLMGQPPDARLTPEIAHDLCQRTQSAAVINGSITSLGSQYVIGLKAVSCHIGDSLSEQQATATGKEQVLAALDKASVQLRERLGEIAQQRSTIRYSASGGDHAIARCAAGLRPGKSNQHKGRVCSVDSIPTTQHQPRP